ncbi:MAG: alpha/beta hydrolase, partial [Desulfuromonadales bacterium]
MKSTRITFPNAEGLELAARLELPEDEKPIAYALFAHCFTCTKNLKAAVSISHALSRRKIAVLRFDFTGLGESEGDFSETTFSSDVSDLVAAAQFLEKKYEAPRLLIGHSLGGTAVLQAAVEIPSTAAVATIAAPSRPSHVLRLLGGSENEIDRRGEATVRIADRDFTVKKRFLDDLKAQKPEEALRAFKAALLVMHSPRDRIVSIDNAADIYKAARHTKSFVSLDPADHLLSDPEESLYAGSIIANWADRYLQAGDK